MTSIWAFFFYKMGICLIYNGCWLFINMIDDMNFLVIEQVPFVHSKIRYWVKRRKWNGIDQLVSIVIYVKLDILTKEKALCLRSIFYSSNDSRFSIKNHCHLISKIAKCHPFKRPYAFCYSFGIVTSTTPCLVWSKVTAAKESHALIWFLLISSNSLSLSASFIIEHI